MRIDSYSFGVMKIDGAEYRSDLIVFPAATGRRHGGPDKIRSDWWRKQGHSLAIEDLGDVLDFKPEVLVVGKGASGLLEIPPSTKKLLQQAGIEVLAENTGRAWGLFNEQIEKGRKVAGAFHLTC